MSLRKAQTLFLYLMVWASLGTVFSAEVYEWPLVIGVYGATVASLALPRSLRERWSKSRFIGLGLALLLISTGLEILSGSRDIISGATLFLIFVLVSRLFTPRTPADATTLLTLSLVVVLAGSALNTSFAFAPFFILVIVCSIWALTTTHLSRAAADQPEQERDVRISRSYLITTSALALVIFVQTTVFFLIFPRMGLGYFKPKVRTSQSSAGFSDRVELGGQGQISEDGTVVVRLEFPEGLGGRDAENLYFRGATLTQFDGRSWRKAAVGQETIRQRADGIYPMRPEPRGAGTRYFLYQEPTESEYLFVPEGTFALRLLQDTLQLNGRPRVRFLKDDRGDVIVLRPTGTAVPIEAWMDGDKSGEGEPTNALTLPPVAPAVMAFADAAKGTDPAPKAIVAALLKSLQGFRYSTTMVPPPAGEENPLAFFLMERKEGHCEYFASALAVMLRYAGGIPARVINGYHGATFNRFGNYYTVQEYRAHSWVEYYDDGWKRVDPTPPTFEHDPDAVIERVAALADMMRYRWNRYILEFDLDTQISAVQTARHLFSDRSGKSKFSPGTWFDKRFFAFAGITLAVGALALYLWRRPRQRSVKDAERVASLYFKRLERLMQKQGMPVRAPSTGPDTYLATLAQQAPILAPDLRAFGAVYLQSRFGPSHTLDEVALRTAFLRVRNVVRNEKLGHIRGQ